MIKMQPTKFSVIEGALRYYTTGKIGIGEKMIISLLLLGYILFPIDLLPDLIPVIGWLDDIGISCLALWYFNYRVTKVETSKQNTSISVEEAEILERDKTR